ncbi:MAG: hypothetical protein V3W18_10450 [candidate division Zixibacteria bacterium]
MRNIVVIVFIIFCLSGTSLAGDDTFGFQPIVNEVSIFQNSSDTGDNLGQTLQIVSINELKVLTTFNFEFTADFNRKMTPGEDSDYYIEIGLVKPVWKKLSANYQRVHGTFIGDPVNQLGVRWSF